MDKKKCSDLNGIYKDIAENISVDVDVAVKFYEHFKGLQITFPVRLMSKEYVMERVSQEYNGSNLKELSKKYGYSERWMRKIIQCCCDSNTYIEKP